MRVAIIAKRQKYLLCSRKGLCSLCTAPQRCGASGLQKQTCGALHWPARRLTERQREFKIVQRCLMFSSKHMADRLRLMNFRLQLKGLWQLLSEQALQCLEAVPALDLVSSATTDLDQIGRGPDS